MDPSKIKIPPIKNLTAQTITENTVLINSNNPDLRMKYVLERLVQHLHDFARETRLSTNEWMAGIDFLTAVGKICSDVRQVRLRARATIACLPLKTLTRVPGVHSLIRCFWPVTPGGLDGSSKAAC